MTDSTPSSRVASLPLPPGDGGLPLVGSTLAFLRTPGEFFERRRQRYGRVFWSSVLGMKLVSLIGPEANRWIFAGEGKYVVNRWSYAIRRLLGPQCMSLLDGEEHRERRRILAPQFRRVGLDPVLPMIVETTDSHIERWLAEPGETVVLHRIKALAFEIAARYLFGDIDDFDLPKLSDDFDDFANGMFAPVPVPVPGTQFGRAMAAKKRLMKVIRARVEARRQRPVDGPDVLATLLQVRDERGRPLSTDAIVDELMLLMFAGHDTTVTATTNAILHLVQHPEVLARAQAEQDGARDQPVAVSTFRAMSYLDQVVSESMRVIPPIGASFRVTTEDVEYDGFRIPAGWTIIINPGGTQLDPELWPDPKTFDPDRWGPHGDAGSKPPFSFIPFGGGPRMCLGQHFALLEMSVILARLLRDTAFSLVAGQDLSYRYVPFPRPKSGVRVQLLRRVAGERSSSAEGMGTSAEPMAAEGG